VLFIHGLGGDAFSTWRHGVDDSTSWPHWLAEDFPSVAVWSLGFAASPTRWAGLQRWIGRGTRDSGYSMPLPARALQVLDRLIQAGIGQRPLILVCHSLGGLLAKQLLMTADDETIDPRMQAFAANTRAVLFLATPHIGAELASMLHAFRLVFGSTVSIEDLRAHDAHLLFQYNWYRRNAGRLGIATKTYYETRGVGGMLAIVNATSAQCGVGPDAVPLDEDHLSIAKPRERDDQVCAALQDLIRLHLFASPRELTGSPAPGQNSGDQTPQIPRELPPVAFKFFGREVERQQLFERLKAGLNTAVVGPAGMGKTALAANALTEVVGSNAIDLENSAFSDGLVFLDLYRLQGQAEPVWSTLANRLRGAEFMERRSAKERAVEACRGKRCLIIIEGGEEADGAADRTTIGELLEVLSPENRWLLLTRVSRQAATNETVFLKEALSPQDAANLLDWLTKNRPLTASTRTAALRLLDGHPLALNWAGDLLARDEEDPAALVHEWESEGLPSLAEPKEAEHTLQWLFSRSVRGLDETTRQVLAAAGMLALAPFPLETIAAALAEAEIVPSDRSRAQRALVTLARSSFLRRNEDNSWQFTHVLGYQFARPVNDSAPVMSLRLATWLGTQLTASLQADAVAETAATLGPQLEHIAALLRTDASQRLWHSLGNPLLYDLSDRLENIGRLDLVTRALQAVSDWLDRIPVNQAQHPYWLFQRCVLMNDQGDVLRDQGDLEGSIRTIQESLALLQSLAQSDPSNEGWQRELSASHNGIGDALRVQGDLTGALAEYQQGIAIRRPLATRNPTDVGLQRDLSVSQERIGAVLYQQCHLVDALAAFQEALGVRRRLAAGDPANLFLQDDLIGIQEKIGEIFRAQEDLSAALLAYQETLESRRRLVEADPTNARWQRGLSFTLNRLATMYDRQGNAMYALSFAEESLEIDGRLASLDPSNAIWREDLGIGRALVAHLREKIGNS
jgi:tetratricopeptide (TPR) repeat protein